MGPEPKLAADLSLDMYGTTRYLRQGTAVVKVGCPSRGIAAGCALVGAAALYKTVVRSAEREKVDPFPRSRPTFNLFPRLHAGGTG